jgi:predicted DNA-binding transcriptional regulator AlpA
MKSMMMKRKDVVEFTGLCYTTIYNMEKLGKFPARRPFPSFFGLLRRAD